MRIVSHQLGAYLCTGLLLLLTVSAVKAHDFWIEPSAYRLGVPGSLAVWLRVGEHFGHGAPYSRNPTHIRAFVIAGPTGTRPVGGRPGMDPAGVVRIDAPGVYVIGYLSANGRVELKAARFERYLREEHLEHVSRYRAEHGQSGVPGRELFSPCAKALVVAGAGDDTGYDRVLGFTLELLPERNPATLQPGDEFSVRLLYNGAPLPNAYVRAINAADTDRRIEARTDARGRARLRLNRGGMWLVRSVHMVPAAAGLRADWQSFWASLTFRLSASR